MDPEPPRGAISVEISPGGLTSISRKDEATLTRSVIGDGANLFRGLRQPPHARNFCVTHVEWNPPEGTWTCPIKTTSLDGQPQREADALIAGSQCELPGCAVCGALDDLLAAEDIGHVWFRYLYEEAGVFRLVSSAAAMQARRTLSTVPASNFEPDYTYEIRVVINPVDICNMWREGWKENCGRHTERHPTASEWLEYARSSTNLRHKYRLPLVYLVGEETNMGATLEVVPYVDGPVAGTKEINPAIWTQFTGF